MSERLSQHPLAMNWLRQFDGRQVHIARLLLDLLKLVPMSEFERTIKALIVEICQESKGRVALFPVDKTLELNGRLLEFHATRRSRYTSAGRIGHLLEALKGEFPRRISVAPTIDSMRSERVKHVVLVDDLIATGKTACDFWKRWAHPSLRSWLSRHNCELWVVAYAGHEEGITKVLRKLTRLPPQHFRCELRLPATNKLWPSAILGACADYGLLTGKPGASQGFQGVMSPVVFEYRCPNSTPSILWDSSGPSWKALFPNRSIPAELHDCFHGVDKSVRHAEELWKSAQYRLALKLLDDQEAKGRSPDYQNLLTLLGMLARGVSHSRGVPVLFTLGHLAAICGVSFVFLHDIVSRRTDEYRVFFIRKKSGGHRRITVPLPSLLIVQSWLQEHILSHQPVHACSQAFSEGCSPAKNAQQHCSSKWLVKIDVENFFESITERHVFRVFKQIGFRPLLSFELARICTRVIDHSIKSRAYLSPRMVSYRIADYRCAFQGHLPQGAPTSPALANLACYNLDEDLNDIAGKYKCVYTRYADDIVFSTQEFSRQTANRLLKDATSSLKRFGLKPNRKKMTIVPPGARRIVTGLVVDGSVPRLSKEYRERIELHLYHAAKHGLAEHCKRREFRSLIGFRNHLHGLITYAEHIEPRFGARCRSEFESLPWGALLDFFS